MLYTYTRYGVSMVIENLTESQTLSPGGPIFHLQEFYYRLSIGDRTNIARAFRGIPLISDPRFGDVRDWPGFEAYVSSSAAWLAANRVHFSSCEVTQNTQRDILEGRLSLAGQDQPVLVLVILVGEAFAGGMKHLRIYHSLSATGISPQARHPLVFNPGIVLPDAIEHFVHALSLARGEDARRAFAPGAHLTAPAVAGLDEYLCWLDGGEPQVWQLCTYTTTGYRHVIEYNLTPPEEDQPSPGGCAVFELTPEGAIERLRIYPAAGS